MNFYDDLDRYGNSTAIVEEKGGKISYREMLAVSDKAASFVPERSLVFLICTNSFESVAAYVGFLRRKAVPALIKSGIDPDLMKLLAQRYQPDYFCCPKSYELQGEEVYAFGEYHLLKTEFHVEKTLHPELALLLSTSGSTGSPKLVRQSYRNIDSNAASIAQYLDITSADRPITTLPMSYTYGLSIINSHLLMGGSVILTEATLMQKEFWQLLKTEKATTFGGVPFIYEMLKKLRFARMELPSIRYITQAGGRLSKEMASEFMEICESKGIKFIVMYGQTEATARMAYLPWQYAKSKAGSIGIAIPGGKLSLADENGKEITQADVTGELVYAGDNVTMGYAQNNFDLGKDDENHGVLFTGDMAKRDSEGFYYIVGRKKRFLKIYGNRVNLDEVEELLKEKCDAVCGGADDHLKIYTTEREKLEEIQSFISAKLGLNRAAFSVYCIERIPRNEAGKVLYTELEKLHD